MLRITPLIAVALMGVAAVSATAKPPQEWDGLQRVKAKKFDSVYLLPGADFRPYTKVMFTDPQLSFRKDWQRNQNDRMDLDRRVTDEQAAKMLAEAKADFVKAFAKAYQDAGYEVVSAPGADVLSLTTAVVNIYVNAPDVMSAGIVRTYSREAGEATLALEARDSTTGNLLGRVVDEQTVGDGMVYRRTSVSNAADFGWTFDNWAKRSVGALEKLKAASPVDTSGNKK